MRYFLLTFLLPFTLLAAPQKAADFTLSGTKGDTVQLSKVLEKNDVAVVVFVSAKCPVSNKYNARYNQLDAELKKLPKGKAAFLAINANHTEATDVIQAHAKEQNFTFDILKDEGNKVADDLKAQKTPEAFVINKKMEVVYHGRIDADQDGKDAKARQDLLEAAKEAAAGKSVSVTETAAFGCSIKRK